MKAPSLTLQIFIGLIVGIAIGALFPQVGTAIGPGGTIFIHLIKTIIAPLVFATLVVGIAGMESAHSLGRLSAKAFLYFEVVTTFALAIGLLLVNVLKPGVGVQLDAAAKVGEIAKQPSVSDLIVHIFPTSVVDSMARGDVLQIVVFSIIFALAVNATKATVILEFCHSLANVMFKYTGYVMRFAPIGVACAMAATVGEHGLGVLAKLAQLVGTLYLALFVFIVCVLLPVAAIAKIPLGKFARAVKEPFFIAFSTTSSEAALPKALTAMESIGVPKKIVSFVLPLGYTFNLDGTTLYLSLASVFVAQAAGVNLTIEQQVLMMLTLMLTSKGVAAVPRASLVILAGTLASFNLPLAGVALILGVDTVMDMARTSVNVLGNCLASCVLARWEGEFDDSKDGTHGHGADEHAVLNVHTHSVAAETAPSLSETAEARTVSV
ncbi:MAG TPA: cation:dicarboxylase symporter family transporter [Candidatus Melainabacteria bacterium]|nr:cation:dicarboxylase symporter family transporter [Candidatus Melainabacteria bacterium]